MTSQQEQQQIETLECFASSPVPRLNDECAVDDIEQMKKVIYTSNQQELELEVSAPANIQSFFAFAIPKSGSVLLDNVLEDICACLDIPAISIAKTAFQEGIEEGQFGEEICEFFVERGYCYYGFRYFPTYLHHFKIQSFKKLLLVRDPRDILVSHYFSMKKSHPLPEGEMGIHLSELRQKLDGMEIDDYVLESAQGFANIFRGYTQIEDENLKVFRYEDIVFEKSRWIGSILEFLGLELEQQHINEIAMRHDVFPCQENIMAHIRKVTPGDHKDKLNLNTIKLLNEVFEDILVKYNYDLS